MKKTTFNLEGYIWCIGAAADSVVFRQIPGFRQLRTERIEAEKKFAVEQQGRLEEAKKLLSQMSDVATEVFGETFPVGEVSSESYEESLNELMEQVTSAYMQSLHMSVIQKRKRTNKFRKAMEEQFGITTHEKDSYEVFRSLLAAFSGKYRSIFKGIWNEYYKEVTKRQKAEAAAEECLIRTLSQINVIRDLVRMWQEGREEEVISKCADIVAAYQAHSQGISKADIKEVRSAAKYYSEEQGDWVPIDLGVIKYNEEEKRWKYDSAA